MKKSDRECSDDRSDEIEIVSVSEGKRNEKK